ncbi:MAG: hypothetical protein DLM72_16340 [Candidatus Nitrosopolaris wilkensis]|nr:MAG: hypothetical protein DLM72_16340 [Candidatus Nitrosopolaris wilkensis]
MLINVIISQEAIQFLHRDGRKGDANIVIYRDNPSISCCNVRPSTFVISLEETSGEKPDESIFMEYDNKYSLSVWVEKRLLSYLENKPVLIILKKGLFKRLQIEIGSEVLQRQ